MVIGKQTLRVFLGMFLICLFAFTTGMHPVLFGGLNNAILVLLLGIFLVWDRKKFFLNNKMMLWALLLVAIMLSNNQDNKRFGTILVYDTLAYILAWLFYILAVKDSKWHKAFFDVCLSFGLFHALATWFFKFVPSLHSSFIVPLLGTWGSHALREVQIGLAPGIAPTYSTNAIYLAFGFCTTVSLFINDRRQKYFIPVLICISALLLTGKRSQLLVSLFAFLLLYYLYNSDKKMTRFFNICGIVLASILVFDIVVQFVPELATFIVRFQQTAEMGDVTLGRTDRFAEAMQIFCKHVFFGIGWNGSSYYFAQTLGIFINVHNIYVQLLCETGIVGSILYFTFFLYNYLQAWQIIKKVKHSKYSESEKATICAAFMIETFFLLYGITGNSLYDFQTLFPYLASCGIVHYYSKYTVNIANELGARTEQ